MIEINIINKEIKLKNELNKRDYSNQISKILYLMEKDEYNDFFNKDDIRKIMKSNNQKLMDVSSFCNRFFDKMINKEIDKNVNLKDKNALIH